MPFCEIATIWSFYQDKDGNNKYYIEYDLVCEYCDRVIGSEVTSGYEKPQQNKNDKTENTECVHKEIDNVLLKTYYTKTNESTHSCSKDYQKVCKGCKEIVGAYTDKQELAHDIVNGKCAKCFFVPSKSNTTTQTTTTKPSTSTTTKKEDTKIDFPEIYGPFDSELDTLFIRPDYSYFGADEATKTWEMNPTVEDNVLKVPLRQFAETMGWEVKWDSETNTAIVISDDTMKFFKNGDDVYEILYRDENSTKTVTLTNPLEIIDGLMYIDIDALLKDSGYSYYVRGEWYWVKKTEEVVDDVIADEASGLQELIPSADIIGSEEYRAKVAEDEAMIMLSTDEEGSWYYTVMVPAAQQAVYGNFNKGEVTWEGVFTQIIVGELPGAGTAADFRDVIADFSNWEWSWVHVGTTALDMIGIIPFIGALKYTDEVASLVKGGSKLANSGTEVVQQTLKQSNHVDNFVDVSQTAIKQSDKVDEVAESASNVAQNVSKASSTVLRQNLIDAGVKVPDYPNAAHHIVAGTSAKAERSREILAKFGIDINDAANGVFLPTQKGVSEAVYHPGLNTNLYNENVYELLARAKSKEDVIKILDDIRSQLMDGTFEY